MIYKEGQICVKPSCPAFFLLRTACGLFPIPPGFSLTLNPSFLLLRPTPKSLENLPYDLVPPTLDESISERAECKANLGGGLCGRDGCARIVKELIAGINGKFG